MKFLTSFFLASVAALLLNTNNDVEAFAPTPLFGISNTAASQQCASSLPLFMTKSEVGETTLDAEFDKLKAFIKKHDGVDATANKKIVPDRSVGPDTLTCQSTITALFVAVQNPAFNDWTRAVNDISTCPPASSEMLADTNAIPSNMWQRWILSFWQQAFDTSSTQAATDAQAQDRAALEDSLSDSVTTINEWINIYAGI
mmetsp:Transcript_23365/g.66203  ORF Transcript_23365/g.66203 Transcript_23365/m.66203 type:complete len:200 (+) Transcript_23365:79-678(+)